MCGIAGVLRFDGLSIDQNDLRQAVNCLNKRGPDAKGIFYDQYVGLCHTRLAILDPEPSSNQPFHDVTGRYVLIYNGEVFNFRDLAKDLEAKGILFQTKSDTEVLLQLLILEGKECVSKLNGFFSFAFYDKWSHTLLLVRDRYGVKPLYIYQDRDMLVFGSEMKALLALGVPKNMDYTSFLFYFQFNYIPTPHSIIQNVEKLPQGSWLSINKKAQKESGYYYILRPSSEPGISYEKNKATLKELLSKSVHDRLVSDVPLGVFLSGGVDSSIVALLAQRHSAGMYSFSIGFKEDTFYDESMFAEKVAKHIGTKHHTFYLGTEEMMANLGEMLDYVDEPFADSSAIAVYNLCKLTRNHVTVALTGDGADEVFGGYTKHLAEWKIRKHTFLNKAMDLTSPLFSLLPESRSGLWGNEFRKAKKYARSISLTPEDRYWMWCSFSSEDQVRKLLSSDTLSKIDHARYGREKEEKLQFFKRDGSLNAVLASDVSFVLEGDMLVKTDRMSMANSVELRNPFLDPKVVDFAFGLPPEQKISHDVAKRILKDTFRPYLPHEVFVRPKHGFEVPIKSWFQKELKGKIETEWLSDRFIEEQGIFRPEVVRDMKRQLFSSNPGDVPQRIWALIVFQHWWRKYIA